jgi:hypothetical protein
VTRDEAREIYSLQIALARTFKRDVFELCERKGVPEEWVLDFVEEDSTFDRFFARHRTSGELLNETDEPRAHLLKRVVRAALLGQSPDQLN